MIGLTDLLIYLDEALTKNLNALVINGYIEKRTSRWIEDRTISGGIRFEEKDQIFEEDRCIKDERDGYKGKNYNSADTLTNTKGQSQNLDGKRFVRREEELTRIYTTFELHQQLINGMNDSNLLKGISEQWINDKVNVGDYIELNGVISQNSVVSYVDTCCNLLNSIGLDNINSIISKKNDLQINNSTIAINQMNYLRDSLTSNNTQDVVINTGSNDIVLLLNNQYLFNNYGNIYERSGCPCKIIGKVIRVCDEGNCIHLLRKTGQPEYYESVLGANKTLYDSLKSNGIIIPNEPIYKVSGKTILVVPISISI